MSVFNIWLNSDQHIACFYCFFDNLHLVTNSNSLGMEDLFAITLMFWNEIGMIKNVKPNPIPSFSQSNSNIRK